MGNAETTQGLLVLRLIAERPDPRPTVPDSSLRTQRTAISLWPIESHRLSSGIDDSPYAVKISAFQPIGVAYSKMQG
jgi:hypothetical protein